MFSSVKGINPAHLSHSANQVESNKLKNTLAKNVTEVSNTSESMKYNPPIPEPDYSDSDIEDSVPHCVSLNGKNEKTTKMLSALTEVYRKLSGVSDVKLLVDFNQEEFIQDSTLAKKGVCVPLASKWLTERDSKIDFFSDIATPEGREEIMHVAMARVKTGDPGVIIDYLENKGYQTGRTYDKTPMADGLYFVTLKLPNVSHNMGLELTQGNGISFFDPNYGLFFFNEINSFEKFLPSYIKAGYGTKSESDTPYMQYVNIEPSNRV